MKAQDNLRDRSGENLFKLMLGVALLLTGAWVGWHSHTLWDSWPSTDAQVVRASVEESQRYATARGDGVVREFQPIAELTYVAAGKPYVSRVPAGPATQDSARVQAALKTALAPGSHHALRYNPKDPSEARWEVLDVSTVASALFLMLAGSLLAGMGIDGLAKSLVLTASPPEAVEERGGEARPAASPEPYLSAIPGEVTLLRCPSCGARLEPGDDSCPNCLKSLRAA
jgi:hypothetical protein